jgi:penicillin-binding protein 2
MYIIMVVFLFLFVRLFYLQIIQGKEFRRLSENNCIRLQSISPPRGLIFDRAGDLLVDNRPSFDVYLTEKDAEPLDRTLDQLAQYMEVSLEDLKKKATENKEGPSYRAKLLMKDVGRDVLARIEAHRPLLPGISVNIRSVRNYVFGKSAAHLIGYIGEINSDELASGKYKGVKMGMDIGKFGVEKSFEAYLQGQYGGRQVEVNASGQVVRVLKDVEARAGYNVYLTIDRQLQEKAEALFLEKTGAAIAMDPNSGEILAMVSSPSFDLNAFSGKISSKAWKDIISNPDRPLENKAIQGEYPPASTYKIVTAIAALEEGVIDENSRFYCPGGYVFGDRVFRCWKRGGHGSVNIVAAIQHSCDVFFYQIGLKLGVSRLASYAQRCGLGELTGIDLDHEAKGLVPTAEWKKRRTGTSWQAGETLSIAIGQGYNLTTPLQLLSLTSAVANGGKRFRPLVCKRIETADRLLVEEREPIVAGMLPVSAKNLDIVKKGLFKVVNQVGGTAYESRISGIEISGKTGTAQIVGRGRNEGSEENLTRHLLPHAWFVAYGPSKDPRIAVVVIVEHGEHGSSAAAPIACEMIKLYLTEKKDKKP